MGHIGMHGVRDIRVRSGLAHGQPSWPCATAGDPTWLAYMVFAALAAALAG